MNITDRGRDLLRSYSAPSDALSAIPKRPAFTTMCFPAKGARISFDVQSSKVEL